MSHLAAGAHIVATMIAMAEDGRPVSVAFIGFEGEAAGKAEAFERAPDGRWLPLGWTFETWRPLFEMFAR